MSSSHNNNGTISKDILSTKISADMLSNVMNLSMMSVCDRSTPRNTEYTRIFL